LKELPVSRTVRRRSTSTSGSKVTVVLIAS
jgi:hypothetical protein